MLGIRIVSVSRFQYLRAFRVAHANGPPRPCIEMTPVDSGLEASEVAVLRASREIQEFKRKGRRVLDTVGVLTVSLKVAGCSSELVYMVWPYGKLLTQRNLSGLGARGFTTCDYTVR